MTPTSKLNNIWQLKEVNIDNIENIKQTYQTSYFTAKLLATKNIPIEQLKNFINPKIKNNWINPKTLPNIEEITQKIIETIQQKGTIGIIGDYDVDGICSSIILEEFFKEYKIPTTIWIPNRQDGYGPNETALTFFQENPVNLLIFVDCGTNSHEFFNHYSNQIIVIDHHHSNNPINTPIINPNSNSHPSTHQEQKELCATTLTLLTISHILKTLNNQNYQKIMSSFLDLNALATVCDMMPMNNFNRSMIKAGLKTIEKQERPGLRLLINFANIKLPITEKDIGFAIGPRINACGRIESPQIALNLLKSKSLEESSQIIQKIEMINNHRKDLQKIAFEEALTQAKQKKEEILCLASKNWNPGIVGIIAAMVQAEENKPTIIGNKSNGIIKASARSKNLNIGLLIEKAVELNLLEKGGGHKNAAGLTCHESKWEEFESWINNTANHITTNIITIDAISTLKNIEPDFNLLAPFGINNEEPKIQVNNLTIKKLINKETYYMLILEEDYQQHTFFINQSQKTLIEELKIAEQKHANFSAIFSLQTKSTHTLEDISY